MSKSEPVNGRLRAYRMNWASRVANAIGTYRKGGNVQAQFCRLSQQIRAWGAARGFALGGVSGHPVRWPGRRCLVSGGPRSFSLLLLAIGSFIPQSWAGEVRAHRHDVLVATSFLNALGQLDFDAAGEYLDREVVLELPFSGSGISVTGKANVLQFLQNAMKGSIRNITYVVTHKYMGDDHKSIALEISTAVEGVRGNYTNRLVAVFDFRNGKISRFREYFGPAASGDIPSTPAPAQGN